jgi:hypothetical protein
MKSLALLLAMLMTMSMFGVGASAVDPTLVSISIGADELEIQKGQTRQLSATAVYSDYSTKTITDLARWASDNTEYVTVSSKGLVSALKITNEPVTIYATYTENGVTKEATCDIKVVRAPIHVDKISWTWSANSLYAGTSKEYSFDYSSRVYSILPDNADIKTATLECVPAYALQIDNEKKTFKVNPLEDRETLAVTLTLTADGAGAQCLPVSKTMTIYRDIPITGVSWDFVNGTRTPWYSYYDKTYTSQVAEYYFMPTEMGNPAAEYKFKVLPQQLNASLKSIIELCDVTFTSSDKRVIFFDEITGRLIPVGNGTADLTITVVTPKGKVFKDVVTAGVYGSPYTPITSVEIVPSDDANKCEVGKDETPKVSLMYEKDLTLKTKMNDGATFDNKTIDIMVNDGRILKTAKKCDVKWTCDNEDLLEVSTNKDGTATIKAKGAGDATVKLTINDSGEKIVKEVRVHTWMSWWEALVGFLGALFTFHWGQVPMFFKSMFTSIGDLFSGSHC